MLWVWAPRAKKVAVELVDTGDRLAMVSEGDGRFSLPAARIVGRYQLSLDDGPPIPDPRANDVESVLGPCHLVDHSAFRWTDSEHAWPALEGAIFYELHIGTFSPEGTFDGAVKKLPALRELGVTHLELMPVATFSGARGWGYDGSALFAPHRAYGGVDGLKRLVDAAHALGLGVILDVVYNHLGPIGNYLGQLGPYFHEDRHTPWGAAINFDGPHSAQVRRLFIDNALHWLRHYHFDGLRLDAIHAIHDDSAVHFLEQLSAEVAELGRPALLIAESDLNDPRVVRSRAENGFGMHAQWSDDFHHALHVALTGETKGYYQDFEDPLPALATALDHGFFHQGQFSPYRQRNFGRPLGAVPLHRLIAFCQNHDHVGNRAAGERLHQLCGTPRAQAAMVLLMLSPHTPLLFQGEEWGASTPFQYFSDHQDPEVARATTQGRLKEFGHGEAPDPQAETTFQASRLRWEERAQEPHRQMLSFTRELIALRQSSSHLRSSIPGKTTVDSLRRTLLYVRGAYLFVLNLGPAGAEVRLPAVAAQPRALVLSRGAAMKADTVLLEPDGFCLLRDESSAP